MQMAGVKGLATVELSGNIRHKTIARIDKEIPGMLHKSESAGNGMLSSGVISNSVAVVGTVN